MGARVRGVAVVVVVLLVGAFLGSTVSQWWPQRGVSTALGPDSTVPAPRPSERVLVEVLNGGGRTGMARRATDLLRDRGYDVVYWGNAASFDHETSVVLDRVGRPELARAVARHLNIRRVRSEPDSNLYLDVTVVLGTAWEPAPSGRVESEEGVPAWWDLRRFFRDDDAARPDGPDASPPTGRMADPGQEGKGN